MNRRTLLAALALIPLMPLPSLAQGVDVSAINTYLNRLRSARGRFRQVNPNGSVQTGAFFLQKPGRIRFEYDTPANSMVIADGTNVAVFDPKSTRVSSRYPLGRTPLGLLLREDLSLREPGMVLGATRDERGTHITVVDPRAPQDGRMVMTFSDNPIALREWVITTAQGQRTQVALTDMQANVALERSLFNIEMAELNRRQQGG
jgi:outer membrane lipoprotein-sorting protein